jgi:hypothetical protein
MTAAPDMRADGVSTRGMSAAAVSAAARAGLRRPRRRREHTPEDRDRQCSVHMLILRRRGVIVAGIGFPAELSSFCGR